MNICEFKISIILEHKRKKNYEVTIFKKLVHKEKSTYPITLSLGILSCTKYSRKYLNRRELSQGIFFCGKFVGHLICRIPSNMKM